MSARTILAVGSIAIDWLELPDGRERETLGGSATYFLLAASRFAPVHVVGIVGSDFPEAGMHLFKKHAANLDDLQVTHGKTFRWGGRYHGDWESRTTLFTELGVFETFRPALSPVNRKCDVIFLGNIQPSLQLDVLDQSENHGRVVVCDTMNLWIETTKDDLLKVLQLTDILLLNEQEASLLTGVSDLEEAVSAIQELGPSQVVVKRGSMGSFLVTGSEKTHIGAFPVKTVSDPTGAGDSFAGGFVGDLARGESIVEALMAGSAVASFCVEGFGVEGLIKIEEDELTHRINAIREKSL
ncbi:MAG: PfkB family carbohydrate kinase [Candidatus Neomarinimicrobiota bacterium]